MNKKTYDWLEQEYLWHIKIAASNGDNDLAYEYSLGLSQYQQLFRTGEQECSLSVKNANAP